MAPTRVVLIVEDEPLLRASMIRGLAKLPGIGVVGAASVGEAKQLLAELDASLLVSDLDLPDGLGVELVGELDRQGKRIPIVFVSAYVGKYRGQLPRRPGVEVYEKPLSLERLRSVVAARLGQDASSPFSVADYVQLAAMGRRSVVLEVRVDGSLSGSIVIRQGEVWDAVDNGGDGLSAFRRLVFAQNGSVMCRSVSEVEGARSIHGSSEAVLLEAARLHDEGAAGDDGNVAAAIEGLDAGWEPSRNAVPTPIPPRNSSIPAPRSSRHPTDIAFADWYERGVDALLSRDYGAAYEAFVHASELRPDDPRVVANIARLRELGHGGGS